MQKLILAATMPSEKYTKIPRIDSGKLQQELLKLAGYAYAQGLTTIDGQSVDLLVSSTIPSKIFDLTDAIAQQDKARSLHLLHSALDNRLDPYYIVSMLCYQFRNLLTIKSFTEQRIDATGIAAATKLHPYVIQKTQAQAARFDMPRLKRLFKNLFDLDTAAKTGEADLVDSLYEFVFSL